MTTEPLDKSTWGDGPWQTEPDRVDFVAEGLACMALRNDMGNWCGYVGVPNDHPAYGKDCDSVEVGVHGGLNYANRCAGLICHEPPTGMPHDVWWLGFDCAHYGDFAPGLRAHTQNLGISTSGFGETYRDLTYVRAEISILAHQLANQGGKNA